MVERRWARMIEVRSVAAVPHSPATRNAKVPLEKKKRRKRGQRTFSLLLISNVRCPLFPLPLIFLSLVVRRPEGEPVADKHCRKGGVAVSRQPASRSKVERP